jgi:hypothetical protein
MFKNNLFITSILSLALPQLLSSTVFAQSPHLDDWSGTYSLTQTTGKKAWGCPQSLEVTVSTSPRKGTSSGAKCEKGGIRVGLRNAAVEKGSVEDFSVYDFCDINYSSQELADWSVSKVVGVTTVTEYLSRKTIFSKDTLIETEVSERFLFDFLLIDSFERVTTLQSTQGELVFTRPEFQCVYRR